LPLDLHHRARFDAQGTGERLIVVNEKKQNLAVKTSSVIVEQAA
jgi:hypothetical protein